MSKNLHKELIRQFGLNPSKPDSFQIDNELLINNLLLWSQEKITLNDIIQKFFGIRVRSKIVAILLELDQNNWIGIAASWQQNNQNGQIRIDSRLTEYLLNKAFGTSYTNQPFEIKKLKELEINVLQSFLDKLETKMKGFWEIDAKQPHLMDTIYLVWLVESDEGEIGRIAFGMPASFKPKKAVKTEIKETTDINKLANTGIKVPIDLKVGSTRLSFNEIKSLEMEDLIIFEDSSTAKFQWHLGEIKVVLPEEESPVFIKDIENIQELAKEMLKTKYSDEDPLSSLPLELSAEFQKISIPLKQVLELKAGGVLPLGSVLDSELTLTAQGKPVAKGELIIVGNQFGMRVTELLIGAKKLGKPGAKGIEVEELIGTKTQTKKEEKTTASFEKELDDLEEG